MAKLCYRLLAVTVVLHAVQPVSCYSFKNCIGKQYGKAFSCNQRKETNISAIVGDLSSAINITISYNQIEHIPERSFAHLPNLTHLRLDQNQLTTIDQLAFQNSHRLQLLNLSFNNISDLKPLLFADLHNLTFLALAQNKLKQLPVDIFSAVFKLETLILHHNNLNNFSQVALSISHLVNLWTIDLSFNNLSSLSHSDVSLPKSLTSLNVHSNNLFTLGCHQTFLSRLKRLNLSFNPKLSTEAFQKVNLAQLNYLNLQATEVNIVDFLNVSNVRANCVDFSGTGLKNDSIISEFCKILGRKVDNVTNLKLSSNGIVDHLSPAALQDCPKHIHSLDLSRNKLYSLNCLNFLNQSKDIKSFKAEHNRVTELEACGEKDNVFFEKLTYLSYSYNRIQKVNNNAFYNTPNLVSLHLNMNTIAWLGRTAFKGLKKLRVIRLDNNLLTDLFHETFEDQVNLKILNLQSNRISVIFNKTFKNLRNLKVLDLGKNTISHIDTQGLYGLISLSKLCLNDNYLKEINSSFYYDFHDKLKVLDLQGNQIRFVSETTSSPFLNLSQLNDLRLDKQQPFGLTLLPRHFFRGLYSLKSLYLTNNHISHLSADAFDDLTELEFLNLDYCCAGAVQLQPGVFKNLKNVTALIVENMGIRNFSKTIFGNLTRLERLHLNHNVMQSIDLDTLESLHHLQFMDIRSVPLSCTCENTLLQNWTVNNPKVQVVYLYDHPCQEGLKYKFYNFDTNVCYVDLEQYLFFTTAAVIFVFTLVPIVYAKLYWTFKYSYFVFRAWFSEQWRRLREEQEQCQYDAFISYNSSDEQWVMEQLLPNLEGNGSNFKLCLHHRDFEVGLNIVDNIVKAVYSSRKTICVVSKNFLRSEWCSLEIQLASYRLFDEQRDVLLLVFLETISDRQMSSYHRMRRVMLKKTYLQWPSSDCSDPEQAQKLFWNQLRRAMKTSSQCETDSCKSCDMVQNNDTQLDTHYLLP